jgi:hypothetical protein
VPRSSCLFKIVQREKIAVRFQALAGGDDFSVDLDGFQDLDDNLILRKDCGEFTEQYSRVQLTNARQPGIRCSIPKSITLSNVDADAASRSALPKAFSAPDR